MSHVPITYTVGNGAKVPFQSNSSVSTLNFFSGSPWIIGGAYTTTVSIVYPSWSGYQAGIANFSLPFSSFTVPKGGQAFLQVSATLALASYGTILYGMPQFLLTTNGGSYNAGTGGSNTLSFKVGRTYSSFSLEMIVLAYAAASVPQVTTTFQVSAILLGLPPSS